MSSAKNKIVLKKLKELNTIWHPESTLVFKSSTEKIVIGRYENEKLVSLDNKCLELCEKWKFKYDKDLIEEEEEVEEKEEENEEEEVEEKEEEVEEKEEISDNNNQKEEVEEKVLVNEEVAPKKVVKMSENNEVNQDSLLISEITIDYTKKIHQFFDKLSVNYNSQILDLKNELVSLKNNFDDVTKKYETECSEHNSTKEQLSKLQSKFDGIKQLFSL